MKLLLAGDICLGEHFFNCGSGPFSKALQNTIIDPLAGVRPAVGSADLFLFNLEAPVSLEELNLDVIHSRCFRGHPRSLQHLKLARRNVASIANNHLMHHGPAVVSDTLRNLKQHGLVLAGLQHPRNPVLCLPCHQQINDNRVTLLSWSWVDEQHVATDDVLYANQFDRGSLVQITECAAAADLLIVSIHAGVEGQLNQNQLSVRLRAIAEAGADIVIAHHSHLFHRIERWHDSVIFYGLGNFVFDLLWNRRLTASFLVELEFTDIVERLQLIPVSLKVMGLPNVSGATLQIDMDGIEHGQDVYMDPRPSLVDQISPSVIKMLHFISKLHKGESRLKLAFLWHKVREHLIGMPQ